MKNRKTKSLILGLVSFLLMFFAPMALAGDVFSDVASDHPYFEAIQILSEAKVIEGYPDHTFKPDKPVNRAEALKIILIGSGIFVPEIQPTDIFPDVVPGVWYAKYVAKAKNLNVIRGDPVTGFFRPGDTVNLAEILKILIESNRIQVNPPRQAPYDRVPKDAWFAPYFEYARLVKLLPEDYEKAPDPSFPITRGLLAELLHRLKEKPKAVEAGKASYYGGKFHGRTTASGEVFDASLFTAAHRTAPFGTWIRVTNSENGKTVVVRVNDRGPYGDAERVIDLSKAAFEAIAPLSRGVIQVWLEPGVAPLNASATIVPASPSLNTNPELCPERSELKNLSPTAFSDLLIEGLPSMAVSGEVVTVAGQALKPGEKVTLFITDAVGKQTAFSAPIDEYQRFSLQFHLTETGTYQLGMIPGENGQSVMLPFRVMPYACLQEKENPALSAPATLSTEINHGKIRITWEKNGYSLFQLNFVQPNHFKRLLVSGVNFYEIQPEDFANFDEGPLSLHLRGASLPAGSLVIQTAGLEWSKPIVKTFSAVPHDDFILNPQEVTLLSSRSERADRGDFIQLSFRAKTSLRKEAVILRPDGKIEEFPLQSEKSFPIKNRHGVEVFPPLSELTLFYRTRLDGLHVIEINNAEGLAALNIPFYPTDILPLLPNLAEQRPRKRLDNPPSIEAMKLEFADRINQDRVTFGKPTLKTDGALSSLAQNRADDMAANNYFSHWNPDGLSANDLRKDLGITQGVSENLAKDVDPEFAQFGLFKSAIHRKTILDPAWTRVGVGIAPHSDGTFIFVQLFSEEPLDLSEPDSLRQKILEELNLLRPSPISTESVLTSLAQTWSEKMASEDFFDFESKEGESLLNQARAAGFTGRTGTYLVGNTSFQGALLQLSANSALQNPAWKSLGIGIARDNLGVIKITLIYSE